MVLEDIGQSDHGQDVLDLLGQEVNGCVTFQGLRRRLHVHQESLTRALRRLEDDELIERTDDGYRLSPQGVALARRDQAALTTHAVSILRTVLPGRQATRQAVAALRQRWFGILRWYGQSEDDHRINLSWTTPDGDARIDARFEGIFLSVEVKMTDPSRLPEMIAAAHRLLHIVSESYIGVRQPALPGPDT